MTPVADLAIREDDLSGEAIGALIDLHAAGMLANSPCGSCHFFDRAGLSAPDVTVWSVWDGDRLAGMGGLKRHNATLGEIKSMRTHPDHLNRGVGWAMLTHIIAVARGSGLTRLSLETGSSPGFDAARGLYERHGFVYCAPFADYRLDPFSRFMTLAL